MNALILAAGYATRMGSLALDCPKALLPVAGRPVLDYLVDAIHSVSAIQQVSLVTNQKFIGHFQAWADNRRESVVRIINDGSTSNEHRLGAIADLRLAIEQGAMEDDLLVAAADNIFMLSFSRFVNFFAERGTDCITAHRENDISRLRKTGVVQMDESGRVISFEEKPGHPRSQYACPPLYILKRDTLRLISEYLDSKHNPDAPGHFIAWLSARRPLHAYLFEEPRYSIGDEPSYRQACEMLSRNNSSGHSISS
jgi:glucose-1-phosphate thymidylyltransferase